MEYGYYHRHLNTDAVGRYDVTPLFADQQVFDNLVRDLGRSAPGDCTHVGGVEALGLVLGAAVARDLGCGFVPVRKGGKFPLRDEDLYRRQLTDYSGQTKTLELARGLLDAGDKVFLVDDWIETGAQMWAACHLVEDAGAAVAGVSVLRAHRDERTRDLFERYDVTSIG
ncbi:phosphoribosyltransferase family protein [Halomarina rubra]|uniref:Phosphoribosyltransferase family protein n=1 Tax=Halomarina rubra TaxID=2071873 RepID=A0ABD6AY21_9EURY|nr:phosphoribosyltransferase family protein [Halomarina rubra]